MLAGCNIEKILGISVKILSKPKEASEMFPGFWPGKVQDGPNFFPGQDELQ